MITFDELVHHYPYPQGKRVQASTVAERVAASRRVFIVLDDDPARTTSKTFDNNKGLRSLHQPGG